MRSDIDRWDNKYKSRAFSGEITPDPALIDHCSLLSGTGRALDLASGECNNALYLASRGYDAFAVDGSFAALKSGTKKAIANGLLLNCFVADLDSYPLPRESFDVVTVIRYLNRGIFDSIRHTVKHNGLLIYRTFNHNLLKQKPDFPERYTLRPGELSHWFSDWVCIHTNDDSGGQDTQSYWVGRKS